MRFSRDMKDYPDKFWLILDDKNDQALHSQGFKSGTEGDLCIYESEAEGVVELQVQANATGRTLVLQVYEKQEGGPAT